MKVDWPAKQEASSQRSLFEIPAIESKGAPHIERSLRRKEIVSSSRIGQAYSHAIGNYNRGIYDQEGVSTGHFQGVAVKVYSENITLPKEPNILHVETTKLELARLKATGFFHQNPEATSVRIIFPNNTMRVVKTKNFQYGALHQCYDIVLDAEFYRAK